MTPTLSIRNDHQKPPGFVRSFLSQSPSILLTTMLIQNTENEPVQPDGPLQGGRFRHGNTTAPSEKKVVPLFTNKGKTAIITGAGAGIGLAVAQGLAESGANVAIWYHSNKKALDRAREIEEEYNVQCEKLTLSLMDGC